MNCVTVWGCFRSREQHETTRRCLRKFCPPSGLARGGEFVEAIQSDLPDGQITARPNSRRVQPLSQKYSVFPKPQISLYPRHPVPTEGRFANVTDAGRDAVDADSACDESVCRRTAKTRGPDTPTLVSSWRATADDGGKKADHRGERGISRKPLRAGMSGDFRWLAVNTRVHTYYQ
jgi:hypothetical protein